MDQKTGDTRPTTVVIFGASGDLTRRKLIPALFNLYRKGELRSGVRFVGWAPVAHDDESFRKHLRAGIEEFAADTFDAAAWAQFSARLHYLQGDAQSVADLDKLKASLSKLEGGPANRVYYLAVAPGLFAPIAASLGTAGMASEMEGWRRIVIEKPFGRDLSSAQELNRVVHAAFGESQVYRMDHYLGKETVQNILFLRFANTVFEPVWSRSYIDHVQITVAEEMGIGHRGAYYDQAGVLRDMFQNHLLQLLSLVAMEPPASLDPDVVRNEKSRVLSAIRPIDLSETVRGQYQGYQATEGVAPDSTTPTYGAAKLHIDNERWRDVPFYLRSGKSLARKLSEIVIEFQCPQRLIFDLHPYTANVMALRIQPDESIYLRFEAKVPYTVQEARSVDMEFHYRSYLGGKPMPDAYELLLLDVLTGDLSLFPRQDGVEAAWRVIDPVVQGWESPEAPSLSIYQPGTWGPVEADELIGRDLRFWHVGCGRQGESEQAS